MTSNDDLDIIETGSYAAERQAARVSLCTLTHLNTRTQLSPKIALLTGRNTTSFARTIPGVGLYFSTYYSLKQHFFQDSTPGAMGAVLLGGGARTVAGVFMLPVTVIKTRFECGRYGYRSVVGALRSVCQTEGPAALFSGVTATLLRDVPFSGIYVMFYSQTKASLPKEIGDSPSAALAHFGCGILAGVLASVITQPADVVKTQVQVNPQLRTTEAIRCIYVLSQLTRNAGKAVTMSGGLDVLQMKEEDVLKFLAAGTHLGGTNLDFQVEQYVYKRKSDGVYIINLKKTWEKLLLAARAIVAIENPADVCVISSRNTGQRAVLKFASATGATTFHGRFTPGTFTNQIQAAFREPRLLIVTDPRADHQPLTEASYVNIPTIALCNTDSPLRYVDIAIPCNNKGNHSVGLMWWMLAREVLRMRGTISREHPWEVMPDLYFYRDPEEIEKEEQALAEKAVVKEEFQGEWTAPAAEFTQPEVADWSEGVAVPSVPIQQFPAPAAPAVKTEDWSAQPATEDWSTAPTAQASDWGGATSDWS
ncbi:hypothetical protein F2P81_014640 [Scophthalmus maximus]|uniref:Small ribosomal subunit protein uS2 n=1 Tax=Scophthalmus maximus TaxID=52904 RepID=A0A6A4SKH8_SCOMX|nr:hypothetical protein F2P81_014640 [Scophthalmus maximus]